MNNTLTIVGDKTIEKLQSYYLEVKEFKNFFIKNCCVIKKYEAYKVWAHWLIRNLCDSLENFHYHIIPNQKIAEDSGIIDHLKEKGANAEKVHEFYNLVISKAYHLYQKYNQFKIDQMTNPTIIAQISDSIQYSVEEENGNKCHIYKLVDTYVKHNDIKYKKLVSLYKGDPQSFNFCMFEIGFNYYILDGQSLQWCLPPKVFDTLRTGLSVKTELFASPTNAHLPLYCSLFYIDKQFGALDNFFNLDTEQILTGTFEVNPPFIEKVFIKSSSMIIHFLEKSQTHNKDLLFIYIMPNWSDSKGYELLAKSKFLIDEIILTENKHFYYHSPNDRMVSANFESHILIVGTNMAKTRWTQPVKTQLIKNFTSAGKKKLEMTLIDGSNDLRN